MTCPKLPCIDKTSQKNNSQCSHLPVAFPHVHSNPLKKDTSTCPQREWSTPFAANLGNKILQEIAIEMQKESSRSTRSSSNNDDHHGRGSGVTFLSTEFITGPVWDISPDFNHFKGIEGIEETKYILRQVTGMNE